MFYHIFNRGVDKRKVFLDESDYLRFIRDMFLFNDRQYVVSTTRKDSSIHKTELVKEREMLVDIHAFALMPNHYHMLVSPKNDNVENISLFMKKLNKGYAQSFNHKYKRSGALWQGKYKKVLIERDAHFFYIPFYIHCNPLDLHEPIWRKGKVENTGSALSYLHEYRWSSHLDYAGVKNFPSVINTGVLSGADLLGKPHVYTKRISKVLGKYSSDGLLIKETKETLYKRDHPQKNAIR